MNAIVNITEPNITVLQLPEETVLPSEIRATP